MGSNDMIPSPHVLIFPLPAQGHVTPMLRLAELLCLAHINVTFVNTACHHKRMTTNGDIQAYCSRYPGLEFKVIPSGISDDVLRIGPLWIREMITGLAQHAVPFLREILTKESDSKITCLISDAMLGYVIEVADELHVPVLDFHLYGASFVWFAFCLPHLIQSAQIPFKDDDMDRLVENLPGMSDYLRRRDLPSWAQLKDSPNCDPKRILNVISTRKTYPYILNTYDDLEGPFLSSILEKAHIPTIYSIGPLDDSLKLRLNHVESSLMGKMVDEDRTCMSWLHTKPAKSVVYVAFGSTILFTTDQVVEIWAGLLQSDQFFIWALMPATIIGSETENQALYEKIMNGTGEKGLIMGWAPQQEILAHPAVGGFFSHSGWNSILESISAGVPMLVLPYISDQPLYSRLVQEVWKVGLDMKGERDRSTVEKMVRDLMGDKKDELQRSVAKMSELAKKSVSEGGSSYRNTNRLVEEIKRMSKIG